MSPKYDLVGVLALAFLYYVMSDMHPPGVNPAYYENQQKYNQPQYGGGMPPQQGSYGGQLPVSPGAFQEQPHQHQGQLHMQVQTHQQPPQHHPSHAVPHAPHPGDTKPILNAANIQHEKEHIAEHLDVPLDTSKMSEQELQFHYFKMHDNDNNNKLDGCELIKSLIHWHEMHEPTELTDKYFEQVIDDILIRIDINWDGYIDIHEYVIAVNPEDLKAHMEQYGTD